MRTFTLAAAAVAAAAVALPAAAQTWQDPSWTVSGGYSNLSTDSSDISLDAVTARVGARFTPYFGAEGELSVGLGDEDLAPGVDVSLSYDAAVYAVGYVPVSPNLELFGRLGYGTTELDVSGAGVTLSEDGDSWNYGVGANYFFDGLNGVRADYTRRDFQDDGGEADVWTINYVRRF